MTPNKHASKDREISEAEINEAWRDGGNRTGGAPDTFKNGYIAGRLSALPPAASSQGSMRWVRASERLLAPGKYAAFRSVFDYTKFGQIDHHMDGSFTLYEGGSRYNFQNIEAVLDAFYQLEWLELPSTSSSTKSEQPSPSPEAEENRINEAAIEFSDNEYDEGLYRDTAYIAYTCGAKDEYLRSISTSIDRYPRWIDAFKELPGEDWEGHIKYADCGAEAGKFGNLDDIKDLIEYEKDHPVMWLYEPSESPAITDK